MKRTAQFQLFLLALTLGFLAGPKVMEAIQRSDLQNEIGGDAQSDNIASLSVAEKVTASTTKDSLPATPYDSLHLDAKSVFVWDINTHRVLYGKNENTMLPLASVSKMMMALVAAELLSPDTEITIAPVDLFEDGDTGLFVGEKWSFEKLLKFTLIASSNDGASAIASVAGSMLQSTSSSDPFSNKQLFIRKMNEKARALGLSRTHFASESGLDLDSLTSGAYGTTRDMAMLFEYIFRKRPELFSATAYPKISISSLSSVVHHVSNTNAGVAQVTGLIGSKTGYTDLAGGNLVIIVDIGIDRPVVIAVLGSTRDGRFSDVGQLIDATVATITKSAPPLETL